MSLADRAKFGFVLPQVFADTPVDIELLRSVALRAEQGGLDSLWTQSQLVGRADALEPLTSLSYAAAITSRVRLGTSVLVVTEHNPLQLAKQLSSLDHLSQGRLIVGLGIGAPGLTADVGGMPMDRPGPRLTETVRIMKALWAEGTATHRGEFWQLDDVAMNPKPVQRPHPTLWFGGHHPNALRRAVRHGDGWMGSGSGGMEKFVKDMVGLREALDEADRDPETFQVAKRVYLAIDADKKRAEERLRARFQTYANKPERATVASLYGSEDEVAEGLAEVVEHGAGLVILNPVYDFSEQLDACLEVIAS